MTDLVSRHRISTIVPPTRVVPDPAGVSTSPAAPMMRPGWKPVTAIATGISLAIVTLLWVVGGGLAQGATLGAALTSMGRLTGLLSSDLLLIQVLLMARVPMIERSYGQDELARIHRVVGFGSFTLMSAHILLTVVGYAGADVSQLWSMTTYIVMDMSAMLPAVAGTACLVMVVVTSVQKARARLRYESWHLIHLYAYLGVFLALPHQLFTGADFTSNPVASFYWWALWGAAVAAVLAYRVWAPLALSVRHRLVVSTVRPGAGGTLDIVLTGRDLDSLAAAPGQFFTWRFLDGPGWTRGHPFSLSAAPDGRTLRISVAVTGDGTARIARLRPGARVLIEGPYGRLHAGVRTRRRVTLIAAGIGIAPMKALFESLPAHPGDLTLVYRTHDREDAALFEEIIEIGSQRGAQVVLLDGPRPGRRESWLPAGWEHVGDAAALAHIVPEIAEQDVYLCGHPRWMQLVTDALAELEVPGEQVHLERFTY